MPYISATHVGDQVIVWERDQNDQRIVRDYPAPYYFYYDDENGEYTTIFNTKVSKREFTKQSKYRSARKEYESNNIRMWETDISPEIRILSNHYYGLPAPKLHVTFFDIEVDYDPQIGFSTITNPYAPINSVAILHSWKSELVVIVVPPEPGWDAKRLEYEVNKVELVPSKFTTRYIVCEDETELLLCLLSEFKDSDVLSGWNSTLFDIPYVAQRITRTLDNQFIDLSTTESVGFNGKVSLAYVDNPNNKINQSPGKFRCFNQLDFPTFGKPSWRVVTTTAGKLMGHTVDLVGRVCLDYLNLYKKYEPGERASYKLAAIANLVLVDDTTKEPTLPKMEYEGSLADLYRQNFAFFVRYNIRDTEILDGFETKLGYVEIANQNCHLSTALFSHVGGTLKLAELALINYCHHTLHRVVKNTTEPEIDRQIDGALVLYPQVGLHEFIGSIDITSLYPTAIRSLNISPETIRGQFEGCEHDFREIASGISLKMLTLVFEDDKRSVTKSAEDWREYFIERKWAVSGYGTVFDQNKMGFIPALLGEWFALRMKYQKMKKEAIAAGDSDKAGYYDRLQYVYKIKLNSLYGALSNLYFRFYDLRMGESTTGTGRAIVRHQCRTVAEILDGKYDVDFPMYEGLKDAEESGYTIEEAKLISLTGPKFNGKHESDAVVYGDSVAGDTIIETSTGPVTIASLFTTVDAIIDEKEYSNCNVEALTYDQHHRKTYFGNIKYVMRHKTLKQMYRVWITNSQYVDVTEDHALIGYANTVECKDRSNVFKNITPVELMHGGSLIYQQQLPYEYQTNRQEFFYPPELYILAGYVMGDGYVDTTSTGGVLLSIGARDLNEVVTSLLVPLQQGEEPFVSSWTVKPNGHDIQISSVRLRRLFRDWLYSTGNKKTPEWMFSAHVQTQQAFLKGWFSADGWINANNTIGLTNIHEHHIQDIRRLLMQCDIASTWCTETTENSFRGKFSGTYSKRLTIKSHNIFVERIGFVQSSKQSKLKVIKSKRKQASEVHNFELVRPTRIEKLPVSNQYVYDIEVDDTHMFFANNILVHNTDSTYFKTYAENAEEAIMIADAVAIKINKSYQPFMVQTFLCTPGYDDLVKCGREVVVDRGIFVEKKRYILHLIDLDGKKVDKMKIMGLDTKKTTLPAHVSLELNTFIERFLKGESWESVSVTIVDYKEKLLKTEDITLIGLPKGVRGIEEYTGKYADDVAARLPGHVAASIHYNECLTKYKDKVSPPIISGMKIKVYYLKGSHGKFKSIALPTDIEVVPKWFLDNFIVDRVVHIEKLVDNPLSNILKAIGKLSPSAQSLLVDSLLSF